MNEIHSVKRRRLPPEKPCPLVAIASRPMSRRSKCVPDASWFRLALLQSWRRKDRSTFPARHGVRGRPHPVRFWAMGVRMPILCAIANPGRHGSHHGAHPAG
jgi:hypothetical protein